MLKRSPVLFLFIAALAVAQESNRAAEWERIRLVIADLNQALSRSDAKAVSQLFTADGDLRIGDRAIASGPSAIESALRRRAIWTEVTAPVIENESVRLLLSDVAIIDADRTLYGSLILKQSVPVTLILKREGRNWLLMSLQLSSVRARLSGW